MGERRVVAALALVALVAASGCRDGGRDDLDIDVDADPTGWQLTVYYTPVERYHEGEPRPVVGCLRADCEGQGDDDLGTYPGDFVDAVELEGNGRITSGPHAGLVLSWTIEDGFWLDTSPRDSAGGVLRAFVTASADPDVLPKATRFRVEDCGRAADGTEVAEEVCTRVAAAEWTIGVPFAPNRGGAKHVDIYVGDESSPEFTESGWYTTLVGAELSFDR